MFSQSMSLFLLVLSAASCRLAQHDGETLQSTSRKEAIDGPAFGVPEQDPNQSDPSQSDDNGKTPDEGGGAKPPVFSICWTKAEQNEKETVSSSPGVSYKIYDYGGTVVLEGNTSDSAAAAAKKQLETERALSIDVPAKSGRYFLAFCDSSKHDACTISSTLMGAIGAGGKKKDNKSWGFRNLRDAPAVLGAIPNMVVANGKLTSADQAFIIYNSVEDPFCNAAWSPLVIDLEGAGVLLSSREKGVSFDMNGDGRKDQISWPLKPSSVFVAMDRNGNGAIDSVHELFGNHTVGPDSQDADNGFAALAKYDANRDGRIDSQDAVFKELRLWGDKNRNGISEASELLSFDKGGVTAIDLSYIDVFEVDAYGNQTLQRSTVTMKTGKKRGGGKVAHRLIFDIWFRMD